MERSLTNFIRALRAAEVPVSTGEAIDALRTQALVGYGDRALLKDALGIAVAKSEEEKAVFDRLFELFFTRAPAEEEPAPDVLDGTEREYGPGEEPGDLMALAQSGDEARLAMALEAAAERVNLSRIRFSTQAAFYTRRMLEEMGLEALEERLVDRLRDGDAGEAEAAEIMAARARLMDRARRLVDQQFEVFGRSASEEFRNEFLKQKSLSELDRSDMERMKLLIRKMARRLAEKHGRRRRKANRGRLDLRATMRANAAHDGVPFDVRWRRRRRDRAKVVAICDTSQSVAQSVRFLLLLLYSLAEVIPSLRSFAFSSRLSEVSADLEALEFDEAIVKILRDTGFGSTNYGQALSDLRRGHWDAIDRRTTVIVLGDGRSNYADPRLDLFRELSDQAKRVIWLSPEAPSLWGSGDSEILRFRPFCAVLEHCANVADLERAVDEILIAYQR
ncbi:MAG: VWA domain-containing protein [Alphaproteobacteria bacterium]|nr:VWA domain-containing protein [Alphaproteobacteria bacterium]